MELITTAITNAVSVVGDVFTAMTGNTVVAIFLGMGLVSGACGIFARMKRSAR